MTSTQKAAKNPTMNIFFSRAINQLRFTACLLLPLSFPVVSNGQVMSASVHLDVDKTLHECQGILHELKSDNGGTVYKSISGCINQITQQSKLVVATVDIAVTATKYLENKDYLGITTVGYHLMVLKAPENKVQFIIGLDQVTAKNMVIDDQNFAIRFIVPRPQLDESMISTDLKKLDYQFVKGGIAPLKDAEIQRIMAGMLKDDLRSEILKQARSKTSELVVDQAGRLAVERLLRKILMNDKLFGKMPWLRIDVIYQDDVLATEPKP
jgi:hypothetical protein